MIMRSISSFGFGTVIKKIKLRWVKYRLFTKTRDELESCSDRELADMGLHRYDIPKIALDHAEKIVANENLKGWV